MSKWIVPKGVIGNAHTIEIWAGTVGSGTFRCPIGDALRVRRGISPEIASGPAKKPELVDFALQPFMEALDRVERDGELPVNVLADLESGKRFGPIHRGVRRWAVLATRNYLAAYPPGGTDCEDTSWDPVIPGWMYRRRFVPPDQRGISNYRIRIWGRCYRSTDGRVHEIRLPTYSSAGRERTKAEEAVAAFVVASANPHVEIVRVREFHCLEGKVGPLLYEGSPAEAVDFHRKVGAPALASVVNSTEYRPGDPCVKCRYRIGCRGLPAAPGLLGIEDRSRPRRTWSVSNGRYYRACPAKDHLRRSRLPTAWEVERSATAERGRSIHDHLHVRHRHRPQVPCAPDEEAMWSSEPDGAEHGVALRMLRHHAEVCPLRGLQAGAELRYEPSLTFDDTSADVVVKVEPDLLYSDRGSWVWREVKTTRATSSRRFDSLESLPQIALAVLVLGQRLLGGDRRRSRVELEVLRPNGVDLRQFDPFSRDLQEDAHQVIRKMVVDWHRDEEFAPRPGLECARCEVRRWCPDALPESSA
ncbi:MULTISPECIES: PD-(D/E)XK nuclease family protein [unclassified Saccharopolyspora]|uniref:PD-(D/E)XK nuclease family protein n=1 Tax=unclassified Saccharopolyspora TaxID=2646250 RepID=UPI001CD3196D|nr:MULTISPECIES: PD-(D/E)XK nuclease family protein [unclassified Saccharopolyspora]MCA1186187.1 PD-(D/E)XK nuclease family protein [Saccharopolyspora sp. 6T]MCA1278390.1 PD-(D/E)XK nuclease family protein [Saccharopolyspora sp. 7B]